MKLMLLFINILPLTSYIVVRHKRPTLFLRKNDNVSVLAELKHWVKSFNAKNKNKCTLLLFFVDILTQEITRKPSPLRHNEVLKYRLRNYIRRDVVRHNVITMRPFLEYLQL